MSVAEVIAVSDRRGFTDWPVTPERRRAVEQQLFVLSGAIADIKTAQERNRADYMMQLAAIQAEQRLQREQINSLGTELRAVTSQQGADSRTLGGIVADRRLVIVLARIFRWGVAVAVAAVGFFFGRDIRDAVMRWLGHG